MCRAWGVDPPGVDPHPEVPEQAALGRRQAVVIDVSLDGGEDFGPRDRLPPQRTGRRRMGDRRQLVRLGRLVPGDSASQTLGIGPFDAEFPDTLAERGMRFGRGRVDRFRRPIEGRCRSGDRRSGGESGGVPDLMDTLPFDRIGMRAGVFPQLPPEVRGELFEVEPGRLQTRPIGPADALPVDPMLHHVELAEFVHVAPYTLLTGLDRHPGAEWNMLPPLELGRLERLDFPLRPTDRVGIAAGRRLYHRRELPSVGHGRPVEQQVLVPPIRLQPGFHSQWPFRRLVCHCCLSQMVGRCPCIGLPESGLTAPGCGPARGPVRAPVRRPFH